MNKELPDKNFDDDNIHQNEQDIGTDSHMNDNMDDAVIDGHEHSHPAHDIPFPLDPSYQFFKEDIDYNDAPHNGNDLSKGLSVENLSKSYKGRRILHGISLNLQRGEVVGLLGPNGAGKTTCFYSIIGLVAADKGSKDDGQTGRILLDGQVISDLPMYQRARLGIGYLAQDSSIFRGMTVEENIMAVLEITESDASIRRRMLDELLDEFSISHLRRAQSLTLSGGERRRLEIARCLATRPHFVLQDEPLAGIDPIAVRDIKSLIIHLKNRGIGVLITDHNVRDTLSIVDRAYILYDGKVLVEGSATKVAHDENARRLYLGEDFRLKEASPRS